ALKLKKYVETEFMEYKNWNIYWDDIAMFLYKSEFELGIREIGLRDITEIDSYNELIKIDGSYSDYKRKD
ncbi:MAG: phosphocholine cytidylyltransferase family protein, partial [Lachnospiraceae bacterium]|nr:phosphocholine cytidylyltransferase family protein [Lachnospiraceae bacterium]